ncbi:MAG: hypothetical protein EHM50_01805 [Lysobacterales bacterium]|nr:MAG: hypothetical protein EHM50_01805 [Xanthomonadales bacterium]
MSIGIVVALAAYPLVVYAVVGRFGVSGAAAVLAAVCLARLAFLRLRGRPSFGGAYLDFVCAGGVLLAVLSFWLGDAGAVRYYPVLVNAALLTVFAASLKRPPSVVERIARLREPDLPPAGVAYTRRVTIAWTVFFALNGAAALYTATLGSLETWALYNGLLAYVLIGALFGGELAIRSFVKARHKW